MSVTNEIAALEKKLGSGATYTKGEHELILTGTVPEWLLRARLLLKDDEKAWASKLVQGLEQAREKLWPKVRFSEVETTPPPAAKLGEKHE